MRGAIPLGRPAIASRTRSFYVGTLPCLAAAMFQGPAFFFSDASTSREERANGMTRSQ